MTIAEAACGRSSWGHSEAQRSSRFAKSTVPLPVIRRANDGVGVDVLLESIGGPVTDAALDALAYDGRMVVFGQASGNSNTVSLDVLMDRSIGVIGYWVTPFLREQGGAVINTILDWVAAGRLRVLEGPAFPVGQAAAAHAAIEARATVGKVTLTVDEASWG